jgi:hypothetical protein
MRPTDCPKWSSCSAPLCPLDPDMHARRHLRGDALCLWVRELAKDGGRQRIRGALPEEAAASVEAAAPAIEARSSATRAKLRAAARSASKLVGGKRLHSETVR